MSTSLQHHQPFRSQWRITQPCRRFWCCSPACVKYLPSLRRSSFRLNTNCNVCSGSFNSHGSAHLDRQSTTWVSVLSTSLTLIPQDHHLDSSSSRQERNLDSIHTISNTPRSFLDLLALLIRHNACAVHFHSTVWHRIIGTRSSFVRVSLQHCLSKSLHTLPR